MVDFDLILRIPEDEMHPFTRKVRSLLAGTLAAVLVSLALFLITSRAAWSWILPLSLIVNLIVLVSAGLHGSRGGILAVLRGQFPPHPDKVPRAIHTLSLPPFSSEEVEVVVDGSQPIARLSDRFLSAAVDLSQVVGGKWWDPAADHIELSSGSLESPVFDFNRPLLDRMVAPLSPFYLRVGGSEADKVFYSLDDDPAVPPGYASVLTRSQWDSIHAFCERNNCKLIFTLNAGPASRREDGSWNTANAEALMAYAAAEGQKVYAWELGNEVNVFFAVHGWKTQIDAKQYCNDLRVLRGLLDRYFPQSLLASQGSAYWPVLGETLNDFFGFSEETLRQANGLIDIFTWHYYPQQSRRCPFGTRRAHPARLLDPYNLDEAAHWAEQINRLRDRYAPGLPVWLGETGSAQCGGEPGVSDTFISGLWWLDELGLMARMNHPVVVRQSLTGMDYGLLDEATLSPRPDYWNSLLWKRLMGDTVYPVRVRGSSKVRIYAHSKAGGGISLLAINLNRDKAVRIGLAQFRHLAVESYLLTAPDLLGETVWLNGQPLMLDADGSLPPMEGKAMPPGETLTLPPLSYGFFIYP